MNAIQKHNSSPMTRINYEHYFLLTVWVLFLIFPLCGVLLALLLNLSSRKINKSYLYLLFLFLSIYLGAINATKTPVSDQANYMLAYLEVPEVGFVKSLANIYGSRMNAIYGESSKEYGYGLLNYVGYYLTLGYYPLFILLFTLCLYFMLFYAIYLFFSKEDETVAKRKILSGVFILAFFTQFFNLTIHLQRQEIAVAVMMLALVKYVMTSRQNWLLIILACSLHTSVVMYVPAFFLGPFLAGKSRKWILITFFAIVFVLSSFVIIGTYLVGQFGDMYLFSRMASEDEREERMSMTLVYLFCIPLSVIAIRKLLGIGDSIEMRKRIFYFVYLMITAFVLITPNNTLQYRFFMISYVFIPFILPQLFDSMKKIPANRLINILVPLFFMVRFYLTFDAITFDYAPVQDVMMQNVFYLLTYR